MPEITASLYNPQQARSHSRHWWAFVLLVIALTATNSLYANPLENERFRFSGFATLGISEGGNDILGHRRAVSQNGHFENDIAWETDTLVGIQLDATLTEKLDAAIQLIAKERLDNSLANSVEWAYLRYRFNPQFTARVGRIGMDLFMLSEYRNLGFAYLWARPPVEFYAPIAFDYFEGGDIAYSAPLGMGTLSTKLFAGKTDNTFEFEGEGDEFELNNLIGATIAWETETWRTRFSIASLDFDDSLNRPLQMDYFREALMSAYQLDWAEAPEILDDIEVNNNGLTYYALGLAFDKNNWVIQSEVSFLDSNYGVIKSYAGRYLSVGYRIGPTTVYSMLAKGSQTSTRTKVPELPSHLAVPLAPLKEFTQELYDGFYADQQSVSLGMRWDIRYDLALKLQWDRTKVEARGGILWQQREIPSEEQNVNTYSINLNYIF